MTNTSKTQFARFLMKRELAQEGVAHVLPSRIDPRNCRCTDCITGYSVPAGDIFGVDYLEKIVAGLMHGTIMDATSWEPDQWDEFLTVRGFYEVV